MSTWKNQRILITGGSKGLGRSLAVEFLKKGASVAVLGRDQTALNRLKSEFPKIQMIQGDISDKNEISFIGAQALTTLGGLDILINNASSLGPERLRLLADTQCEDFETAIQTNLLGAFRLTKVLLAPLLLQKSGIVVNITSDASVNSYPSWGAYGASKAALDHLTRTFAEEHSKSGVHFFAVDPGDMNTDLHRQALPDSNPDELKSPDQSAALLIAFLENSSNLDSRVRVRL
jgi:NAD(P)-dependent dehydrogenase (short-subunit alcohol dehydrogenase family)